MTEQIVWGDIVGRQVPPDFHSIKEKVLDYLSKSTGPLKLPLLEVQKKSVAHAVGLRYCCLFDDMGLGKTAQALAINAFGGHKCTLILCPNNVKKVWAAEIIKFTGTPVSQIYIGSGSEITNLPLKIAQRYKYIVFNYEALVVAGKTPKYIPSVFTACQHHILDEAHYLRNAHTARYMSYYLFLQRMPVKRLTILTGTPLDRCINEAFVYLALLDFNPKRPGKIFHKYFLNSTMFSERYAKSKEIANNTVSTQNYSSFKPPYIPEIGRLFGDYVIRRKIHEVVELKPLRIQEVRVSLTSAEANFEQVTSRFSKAVSLIGRSNKKQGEFDKKERGGDAFLKAVQKIRTDIALEKTHYTLEMAIKYYQAYGPVIIFSEFIMPLEWLKEAMFNKGYKSLFVIGEKMKLQEREDAVNEFKEKRTPFLLATFGAMSEGENLQEIRTIIMNDLPWQPLVIKQAQRRIWRIGQKHECYCCIIKSDSDYFVERNIMMKQDMIFTTDAMFDEIKIRNNLV